MFICFPEFKEMSLLTRDFPYFCETSNKTMEKSIEYLTNQDFFEDIFSF